MIRYDSVKKEDYLQLRHRILRPHQDISECIYANDEHPLTLHWGAYEDGVVIGVSTILPEDRGSQLETGVFRIRGMAVIPERQGQGIGRRLVEGLEEHVRTNFGKSIWCNGRVSALSFYLSLGFKVASEEFELIGVPHVVLEKRL